MSGSQRRISFTLNGRHVTLDAGEVTARLAGVAPEQVRQLGVRVGGGIYPVKQAFEVATGIARSEYISHTARRHLAALGFELVGEIEDRGMGATRSTPSSEIAPSPGPTRQMQPKSANDVDVLLVTCVKEKLRTPAAARDLYISPLFQREREYAERSGKPWFILSAEHGLVRPDDWLAPYERYLPDTPPSFRKAWGTWVAERLELLLGSIAGLTIEIHAGAAYVDSLRAPLRSKGAELVEPLAGLTLGQRLAWYRGTRPENDQEPSQPSTRAHESAADFCRQLSDQSEAVSPTSFLAGGPAGMKVPGLYSWWVDEPGAADLSRGLGHVVNVGMIYAGLAGATTWPSGSASSNTLWSRIAGMHLGKRHAFSTFRRTLGSILAEAAGAETIDEVELTRWMHAHLEVLPIPFEDADTLGRLEADVLRALDPPLNLMGMERTALRARLTELRRRYSAPETG